MSDFDSTDGCLVSKTKDENEASSQIATQPCDECRIKKLQDLKI